MDWIDDWAARGACRNVDPDSLFVQGAAQNRAKAICLGCPVPPSAWRTAWTTTSNSACGAV